VWSFLRSFDIENIGQSLRNILKQKDMVFLLVSCSSIYAVPLAVLYFVWQYLRQLHLKDFHNPRGQLVYPYFFLGVNALISSIYSLNLVSIGVTVGIVIPFLIYAVYVENRLEPGLCVSMLRFMVYLSLPAALVSYFQKLFIPLREGRVISTFANANLYAYFLMAVLLVTLGLYMDKPPKRERRWYLLISAANLVALYLTKSRAVLLALAVSVLFLLLLRRRFQQALFLFILCGIFLITVIIYPQLLRFIPRYEILDANMDRRAEIWGIAWDAIRTNPLIGRGILSYKYYAIQYNLIKTHAHNTLLNTWVEWGLAGVGLLLWASIIIFRRGLWGLQHSPYRNHIAVILSCMFGSFVYGIVDNPIVNVQTGILYLLLTSMVMVFTRDYPHPSSPARKSKKIKIPQSS
jgi:O-antigen ligase